MKKDKKAILVVSFGTSYEETREKTIGAIERDIQAAYPDYEVRRAFTSGMILKVLAKRDGLHIDNVKEAMEGLAADGFQAVYVQPTHILNGEEYDDMVEVVEAYKGRFQVLEIGAPLLTSTQDYRKTIKGLMAEFSQPKESEALLLMGHGTEHHVNAVYPALDYHFKAMGYPNVFVGTVEAYPTIEDILKQLEKSSLKKVHLLPFMVVAGDHARSDMAGDEEDSWKEILKAAGYEVDYTLKGLGEFPSVREIYVEHVAAML